MIVIEDKVSISNKICNACDSKNVKVDHRLTELGGPPEWKSVSYYVPVLKCEDCKMVIPQKEEKKIRNKAMQIAQDLLTPEEIISIRKKLP